MALRVPCSGSPSAPNQKRRRASGSGSTLGVDGWESRLMERVVARPLGGVLDSQSKIPVSFPKRFLPVVLRGATLGAVLATTFGVVRPAWAQRDAADALAAKAKGEAATGDYDSAIA